MAYRYVPGYLTELKEGHAEELALFKSQLGEVRKSMVRGGFPVSNQFVLTNSRNAGKKSLNPSESISSNGKLSSNCPTTRWHTSREACSALGQTQPHLLSA